MAVALWLSRCGVVNIFSGNILYTLLKVVFRHRSSSVKGCLPSKVVFCQRLSSIEGRLPSKVVFGQRLSSVLLSAQPIRGQLATALTNQEPQKILQPQGSKEASNHPQTPPLYKDGYLRQLWYNNKLMGFDPKATKYCYKLNIEKITQSNQKKCLPTRVVVLIPI